jgi:RNA polymerase sigma factor (sigma-70 family)
VVSIDSGNHRARFFERRDGLVTEHMEMVEPIARGVFATLPPSFDLEDLIQTGRVALLDAATRYRPRDHGGTPFSAWARQRVRGAMLDSVKGRNYEESTRDPLDGYAEPAAPGAVEQQLQRDAVAGAVRDMVGYLNEREAEVIWRAYSADDSSCEEIGVAMNLSRSSVQAIRASALEKLRILAFTHLKHVA